MLMKYCAYLGKKFFLDFIMLWGSRLRYSYKTKWDELAIFSGFQLKMLPSGHKIGKNFGETKVLHTGSHVTDSHLVQYKCCQKIVEVENLILLITEENES